MSKAKCCAQDVRETVRAGYAQIAQGRRSGCCGNDSARSGHADPNRLAKAIGYDAESLAVLPEGANMGLSCGNPVAIAALREGQVVLDLGAGGGFDVFQAGVRVGKTGRVIGVDMTPEMLAKARNNIAAYRKRAKLDNVEFRLGEIEHLPVADAAVDVILSNCVINLSPDKAQVWREAYRVLRRGGRISVSDIALLRPLPSKIRAQAEALVGCVAGAVLVEDTRRMLSEAGFKKITLTPKPGYVESLEGMDDPLYRDMAKMLPKGRKISDYVTSLNIEAAK